MDAAHEQALAVGVVALGLGHHVGVVHVPEVGGVHAVLGDLLPRGLDDVLPMDWVGPLVAVLTELRQFGHLEAGGRIGGVIPRHDHAVAFDRGVGLHHLALVHAGRIRNVGVLALAVEAPAVEGAHDLAVLDHAAVPQVGAHVGAERILNMGLTVVVAPQHQVAAEVLQGLDIADGEVGGIRNDEPAERYGER